MARAAQHKSSGNGRRGGGPAQNREPGGELLAQARVPLEEAETQFRLLVEEVQNVAIFLMDPHGVITVWNEAAHRMKGWPAEEAVGQHYRILYRPEDAEAGKPEEHLAIALRTGKFSEKAWRMRKDGSLFWADVTATPLFDEAGELRGFAKITQDRSTERRLEEELQDRVRQLAELDRRKDEFLAMLGHELRSPLSAVTSAAAVLEQCRLDERGARQLSAIKRQIRHLGCLTDDLLDMARIGEGKLRLRRRRLDLAATAREAVEVALPLLESRGQDLVASYPAERLDVDADPTRLVQILVNLLNNAATYSGAGSRVWLTVEREADGAAIRVVDEGLGIDPILLPTLFDLYVQVEAAEGGSRGGLGIGLHLVKRLVELHGGTVRVTSEGLGKGAEFVVYLPLVSESQP